MRTDPACLTPEPVTGVRGKGLMLAVEFDEKERRDEAIEVALARGLLTLGCGEKGSKNLTAARRQCS